MMGKELIGQPFLETEYFKKEGRRYLGFGKQLPDETVQGLIGGCAKELWDSIQPRHLTARYPLVLKPEGEIRTAGLTLHSRALSKNLHDCKEVIFFAATLGNGVDMLIARYSKIAVSKAAIMQAVAATVMEEYCDRCQERIKEELQTEGLTLRPRFSPGFGDLSLQIQRDFLNVLNAGKYAGIFLSEGNIMLPEKSVTAFMGVCRMGDSAV